VLTRIVGGGGFVSYQPVLGRPCDLCYDVYELSHVIYYLLIPLINAVFHGYALTRHIMVEDLDGINLEATLTPSNALSVFRLLKKHDISVAR